MWERSTEINYRAPHDMTAGFYNLSLFADGSVYTDGGYYGDGMARMYPIQETFAYGFGYNWDWNFGASLSGGAHSICILPVVTDVSPDTGSVAGGTEVTIRGHGFSTLKENMIVYVAGRRCDVTRLGADGGTGITEQFTCIARPADAPEVLRTQLLTTTHTAQFIDPDKLLPSTRNAGSAGWWMRWWDYVSYQNNQLTDANVRLSMNLRQPLSLSLSELFGPYWPGQIEYLSQTYDARQFAIEFATDFIAPYTGKKTCG